MCIHINMMLYTVCINIHINPPYSMIYTYVKKNIFPIFVDTVAKLSCSFSYVHMAALPRVSCTSNPPPPAGSAAFGWNVTPDLRVTPCSSSWHLLVSRPWRLQPAVAWADANQVELTEYQGFARLKGEGKESSHCVGWMLGLDFWLLSPRVLVFWWVL